MRHAALALTLVTLATLAARGAAAGPRLGIEAGLGLGRLSTDATGALVREDDGLRPWPALALSATWTSPAGIRLGSGLRYVSFADRLIAELTDASGTTRLTGATRLHYLSVPARLELHPFGDDRPGLVLGPELAVLAFARREVDVHGPVPPAPAGARRAGPLAQIFEELGTFDREGDVSSDYERVHVLASAGLAWSVPLAGGRARADVRWVHGLGDVRRSGAVEQRTGGLELTVGFAP